MCSVARLGTKKCSEMETCGLREHPSSGDGWNIQKFFMRIWLLESIYLMLAGIGDYHSITTIDVQADASSAARTYAPAFSALEPILTAP